MRTIVLFGLMSLLALAPFVFSGPIPYGALERAEVGEWKKTQRFRGGERATVLARGEEKSTASLQLTITDEKGNIITQANAKKMPNPAAVACFWYPPRDGDYTIEIKNANPKVNTVYVTIK